MATPFGGGGGGLPLGDLGSGISGALRDANGHNGDRDTADPLKDPNTTTRPASGDGTAPKADTARDADHDSTRPAASTGTGTSAPAAGPGQNPPGAPADTAVELPDGTTQTVTSAVAKAGREILAGASIDDAYPAAGIQLPPLGAPVTTPVSPAHLQFGDIGQYSDRRVMALGPNKVWVNGQVIPLEQLQTGPNFLGWQHPAAPAAAAPVTTLAATR
jgi:hypothetical protein